MNSIPDLIAGQTINTIRRHRAASEWMQKQDLGDVKSFHITTTDHFSHPAYIDIHLGFETMEKARYWAAKNLRDIEVSDPKWCPVFTGLRGHYSQRLIDFNVFCHFPIEQKAQEAV